MANRYVTDDMKAQSRACAARVERDATRRFTEAIGDPDPLFNDEANVKGERSTIGIAIDNCARSSAGRCTVAMTARAR